MTTDRSSNLQVRCLFLKTWHCPSQENSVSEKGKMIIRASNLNIFKTFDAKLYELSKHINKY